MVSVREDFNITSVHHFTTSTVTCHFCWWLYPVSFKCPNRNEKTHAHPDLTVWDSKKWTTWPTTLLPQTTFNKSWSHMVSVSRRVTTRSVSIAWSWRIDRGRNGHRRKSQPPTLTECVSILTYVDVYWHTLTRLNHMLPTITDFFWHILGLLWLVRGMFCHMLVLFWRDLGLFWHILKKGYLNVFYVFYQEPAFDVF